MRWRIKMTYNFAQAFQAALNVLTKERQDAREKAEADPTEENMAVYDTYTQILERLNCLL